MMDVIKAIALTILTTVLTIGLVLWGFYKAVEWMASL